MAKDEKPAVADAAAVPAKKNKKLLIISIVALLLVLGLVGAGALVLLKPAPEYDEADGDGAVESTRPAKKKKVARDGPPIYVTLDTFTVNLVPEDGDHFLQLILSVEVHDDTAGDQIKAYMPKLRNDLTLLLSSKKASELINTEGKERLALEIKKQMNAVLGPASRQRSDDSPIREVLFTSFIIQ